MFLCISCTILPKGNPQLKRSIEDDKESVSLNTPVLPSQLNRGRPIYLEVHSYPQLLNGGHISLGGKIYLYGGREELRLDEIIKPTKEIVTENTKTEKISRFVVTVPAQKEPEMIHVKLPNEDTVTSVLSSSVEPELNNNPLTPGEMPQDEASRLKKSSVKSNKSCIRPIIVKNNGCEDMEVNLSFTECIDRKDVRKTKKEYCFKDRALFTHSYEGATFQIYLKSSDGRKYLPDGEITVGQ